MAKKQKRNVSQSAVVTSTRTTSKPTTTTAYTSSPRPMTSMDFNPDYSYVKQDLRRIGITAASFIAALFALYFIIR